MRIKWIISMTFISIVLSFTFMAFLYAISKYTLVSPRLSDYANCQQLFPERVLIIQKDSKRIWTKTTLHVNTTM